MTANPNNPSEPKPNESARYRLDRRGKAKKARMLFIFQIFSLVLCGIAGLSETYPWLDWGEWLVLFAYLPFINLFIPPLILVLGEREGVSSERLIVAFCLSGLMTAMSFYVIMPLC